MLFFIIVVFFLLCAVLRILLCFAECHMANLRNFDVYTVEGLVPTEENVSQPEENVPRPECVLELA